MNDSIFTRQNDPFLLQCQAAQKSEYSQAKKIARTKAIVTLLFVALSIISSILSIDWLSAVSSFLAVALTLYNKRFDYRIHALKEHAASIQQFIDATIFAPLVNSITTDWGDIPSKTDLAESISKFHCQDTSAYKNWYSDYSSMSSELQIFYCQCENVRWDITLHKEFKKLCTVVVCAIFVMTVAAFLAVNPTFTKVFWVLSWFLPVAEYGYSVIKEINDTVAFLHDAESFSKNIENKLKNSNSEQIKHDLIQLQHKIWHRRSNGYLIPDWFYAYYKQKHQEKEDRIARTIQNMEK